MSTVSDWDNEYARMARAASQLRTAGLSTSTGDVQALQTGLQRLERSLDSLSSLPATEVQRRRRLIQHLKQTSVVDTTGGSTKSQMQMAMQQQDLLIDDLAVGMGRLKNQTSAIHEEANLHVNLLNDMDTNLDSARDGLEDETRRAARLREDQSVWRLQMIVAALLILLVLLILMGLSP